MRTIVWIKAFAKRGRWLATLALVGTMAVSLGAQSAASGSKFVGPAAMAAANSATPTETKADMPVGSEAAGSAAGLMRAARTLTPDPCGLSEVSANPTRPAWDYAASTTQCGIAEMDSGWELQPMGRGVSQRMLISSVRYGMTPKLDLRWGITGRIVQSGGGTVPLEGVGDQWLNARYRFVEQSKWMPALALDYGYKIPMANPAKGFGSGFADNQFILIASRDLGRNHLDFNTVGTVVGGPNRHDGAAQFGLALTRPVTAKLSWMLESYGGPQPGTSDRFGAAFTGAAYTVRPALVVDGAYSRTYTAGTPRQQFLFGMTFAMRPGLRPIPKGKFVGRMLGR